MKMERCGTQIQEAPRQRKQTSKSFNGRFPRGLTDSSHNLISSETVILASLLITSKALLLMRMWLDYVSTMTL